MDLGIYKINYDQIIEDSSLPYAIRILAAKLKTQPMMTVGKFFANLNDEELDGLHQLIMDHDAAAPELLLLTMMLSAAEGTSAITEEELNSNVTATVIFISTTVLHREGLVTAYFDVFSYGEDMADMIMAEPTDAGNEYVKTLKNKGNDDYDKY